MSDPSPICSDIQNKNWICISDKSFQDSLRPCRCWCGSLDMAYVISCILYLLEQDRLFLHFALALMLWFKAFFTVVFAAFQALARFYVAWAIRHHTWWIGHLNFMPFPLGLDVLWEILENGFRTLLSHRSLAVTTFGFLVCLHGNFELFFTAFHADAFVLAFGKVAVEANFTLHAKVAYVSLLGWLHSV